MKGVYIGTSGWTNKDWGEEFYPPKQKNRLSFFAQEFSTVEVNTSFYRLPLESTFAKWREETPDDFVFAVKLSRFITHEKRLVGVRLPVERFIKRATLLEHKLGPILVQLPPYLKFDAVILEKFLEDLRVVCKRNSVAPRFALEPRHHSWIDSAGIVRELLRKENIAIVFPHSAKIASFPPTEENSTADFVYLRFHGPSEFAASRYGPRRLRPWADRLRKWQREGLSVFAYFNNDVHGHAVHDARTLIRQVEKG